MQSNRQKANKNLTMSAIPLLYLQGRTELNINPQIQLFSPYYANAVSGIAPLYDLLVLHTLPPPQDMHPRIL
jgi:hypothetical protein